jgi:integrase
MTQRTLHKLSARTVASATKPGRYGDGGGLYLVVTSSGSRKWVFRYTMGGEQRDMGLGAAREVTLAKARELANIARGEVQDGLDPIEKRQDRKLEERAAVSEQMTFKECAEQYIAANESGWRNAKHRAQWKSTFNDTRRGKKLFPALTTPINDVPVRRLGTFGKDALAHSGQLASATRLVLQCIEPVWATKTETASRARGRIESVLDWAKVSGFRQGENPARWQGHLDQILPRPSKLKRVRHHPALPYEDLPAFMVELRGHSGESARALEFTILTAARTGAVIGATASEIDLASKVWTVPAERAGTKIVGDEPKARRVPLCDRAIEILDSLPSDPNGYLFAGAKPDAPLSDMAMLELMREICPDYVPHGFRSTFKDWCSETTNFPNEVSEAALWHGVADKVEAAYRRGDLFEKRRALMTAWEAFCNPRTGIVVQLPVRA